MTELSFRTFEMLGQEALNVINLKYHKRIIHAWRRCEHGKKCKVNAQKYEAQRQMELKNYPDQFLSDERYCKGKGMFHKQFLGQIELFRDIVSNKCRGLKFYNSSVDEFYRKNRNPPPNFAATGTSKWPCPKPEIARKYFKNVSPDFIKLPNEQFCFEILKHTRNHYDICTGKSSLPKLEEKGEVKDTSKCLTIGANPFECEL